MNALLRVTLVTGMSLMVSWAQAEEAPWSRFRGPNGAGISEADTVPVQWTADDYNWVVRLPGEGLSSPVVWEGKLFLTAADEAKQARSLLCYNTTDGSLAWSKDWPLVEYRKHRHNSYATSTPAVDELHVYTAWFGPEGSMLVALDHDGRQMWEHPLPGFEGGHGGGASPIVVDDLVVLVMEQEGDSFLLAVDRRSGAERWRVPRGNNRASYSTPCVYTGAAGRPELIFTSWFHGVTSVDPASGKINWEIDVFEHDEEKRSIGSPVVAGDLVIGTSAFAAGKKILVAIRPPSAPGEQPKEEYRMENTVAHMPTVLVHDGLLFVWDDKGIATCLEADSGELVWRERIGGNYASSPVCVGGRLYTIEDSGEVVVCAAAREFEELARIDLGEGTSATPAMAEGVMYIRTLTQLFSLGGDGR